MLDGVTAEAQMDDAFAKANDNGGGQMVFAKFRRITE